MTTHPSYVVLTHHGTVICLDVRLDRLVHVPSSAQTDHIVPVKAILSHETGSASVHLQCTLATAEGTALKRFRVQTTPGSRRIHLLGGTSYLTANAGGSIQCDRPEPRGWESFLLLSETEMQDLAFVAAHQWVYRTTRLRVAASENPFEENFRFRLGAEAFDLSLGKLVCAKQGYRDADFAGNSRDEGFLGFTLVRDGWKVVDELRLIKPLVYLTAFGAEAVFKQLYWSLMSLAHMAGGAHIHIISDRSRKHIAHCVPEPFRSSFTLQQSPANDYKDFCLARYRIGSFQAAARFQPLMYMDTDIAVNRPLDEFFAEVALSDRIHACTEPTSPLDITDSVGAYLFKQHVLPEGSKRGFNAGCLALPNLATCGKILDLIIDVYTGYGAVHGESAIRFADQPFVNYVGERTNMFTTSAMNAVMAVGEEDFITRPPAVKGLVHFWPARGQANKATVMQAYVGEHVLLMDPK